MANEEGSQVNTSQTSPATTRHPLDHTYSFWMHRRSSPPSQENYEQNIIRIGSFDTVSALWRCERRSLSTTYGTRYTMILKPAFFQVEQFWGFYSHIARPNDLPNTGSYHMFRQGIKPMWEVSRIPNQIIWTPWLIHDHHLHFRMKPIKKEGDGLSELEKDFLPSIGRI
jgi:hypothetical protein